MMLQTLAEKWWLFLVRGVLAIIFGIIAFTQPAETALALVFVFGAYAIAEGLLTIWGAIAGAPDGRLWYIIWGAVSVIAGLIAFTQPLITALALIFIIGVWAIVTGVVEIMAAIRLRQEISGEFWLIVSGILSVIAGFILIARPVIGGLTVVVILGIYAILFGVSLIFLSFRLKGLAGGGS